MCSDFKRFDASLFCLALCGKVKEKRKIEFAPFSLFRCRKSNSGEVRDEPL
jgi:hypothetical protein